MTNAEYQDFRFSFWIHMSLVSPVPQLRLDKCEIEKNPISLQAVKTLGHENANSSTQIYYSLALITKSSVKTLVRTVKEANGADAWRLIHSRYAPDTQNRQYALMQKIMAPAKSWREHQRGFESGLRAWVGEWDRVSGTSRRRNKVHSDDEHGPVSSQKNLHLGARMPTAPRIETRCCNGVTPHAILEARGTRVTLTEWKWTLSEKARPRARAKENINSRKALAEVWIQTRVSTVSW